jgi:hypothetical protein
MKGYFRNAHRQSFYRITSFARGKPIVRVPLPQTLGELLWQIQDEHLADVSTTTVRDSI